MTIWGDGSVVRDYLCVSDLVEALKLAAQAGTEEKTLNVGSSRGTSLNELVAVIAEVTGERPAVEYVSGRALTSRRTSSTSPGHERSLAGSPLRISPRA